MKARILAAHVAGDLGFATKLTAQLLGVGVRAVQKLYRRDVDPTAIVVLRRRMALLTRVAATRSAGRGPRAANATRST